MNISNNKEMAVAEMRRPAPSGLGALFSDTRRGFSSLVDVTTTRNERSLFNGFQAFNRPLSNSQSSGGGPIVNLGATVVNMNWVFPALMTVNGIFSQPSANSESPGGGSTVDLGFSVFVISMVFPDNMTINNAIGPTNL